MAPAAHLINLKVLGSDGTGEAAHVVAAIDFAIEYREERSASVLNPARRGADAELQVRPDVPGGGARGQGGPRLSCVGGNYGQADDGWLVYGSVTSPGISPYAITGGRAQDAGHGGSVGRRSGVVSLEGPDAGGSYIVKPDLVAPGSRIVSTAVKESTLASMFPERIVDGLGVRDYLALSGTSMAAAAVAAWRRCCWTATMR